jgi:hypothetical protein
VEYTTHAEDQMVDRNITRADFDAVLAAPTKEAPGLNGCFNLWGSGPSKKRIRVTLDPTRTRIITVANADSRTGK